MSTAESTTTTETTEAPRIRALVVEDLVTAIKAREGAKGNDKKPFATRIAALEQELLSAPLAPANTNGKGVVNIPLVESMLTAEPTSAHDLVEKAGYEPTAAIKARFVHWARREGAETVEETGRAGKYLYARKA